MLLDLIVTHYNEPYEIVKPYFDMLCLQRMVNFSDFRVILVHDGEDCRLPELSARSFPFEFVEYTIPHKGVSAARNFGIDHSDAEWIMFCDCDDCFSGIHSLSEYISALDKKEFSVLWAPYFIELGTDRNGPCKRYIFRAFDTARLVGKVFKRKLFLEKKLRFSEDLWCGEDMAFIGIMLKVLGSKKVGRIGSSFPLYAVIPHKNSVTHDPNNRFRNAVGVYHKQIYMAQELERLGCHDDAVSFLVRSMTDAYLTLSRTDIDIDRTEFDNEVWEFYKDHKKEIHSVDKKTLVRMLEATLNEFAGTIMSPQAPMAYEKWLPIWVKTHEEAENKQ